MPLNSSTRSSSALSNASNISNASNASGSYVSEMSKPLTSYKKDGFNIEDYRDVNYPFVQPENKDFDCAYWSCREYPCRCMVKKPKCQENYIYNGHSCEPTDKCLNVWKGCGAGEIFSYEFCQCECYIECASDEIRLPGVCLCGKGTFPVYNEWAAGRYFGEKNKSTGFNK